MERTAARPKTGRPLQNLLPIRQDGFVEAVPSRAFRDGTGIFLPGEIRNGASRSRKCESPWREGDGWSPRLSLHHLAGSRYQSGDVDDQSSFRYSREVRELNSHPFIYCGVLDDPLQRDVRLPGAQ